jgi:chaperonin GroEL
MKTQPVMPEQGRGQTREDFIKQLFPLELPKDNYLSGKDAVKKLIKGVEKGFDVIKGTYGPAGSNVVIKRDIYPFHESTNDGKKILEGLRLADPYEMIGLNTMKEVADKCDKESGDGRKTASILYAATLLEGQKVDEDPMEVKRSLEACIPIIKESILKQTKAITVDDVGKIATIASESPKLGALFQEIYQQIGSDGIIELENSDISETYYEITEGVKLLNCKMMYPYMANDDKRRKCEMKDPYILISKQKIASMAQLDPIIKSLLRGGTSEMVIFCDDIELSVSQALAYLSIQGADIEGQHVTFRTLVIKAPVLWKDWLFEDFAKITGAKIIDPAQGTNLKNFRFEYLGRCDKIITSMKETVVLGTKDITEHIETILSENTDEAKIRASRLKTKTAILRLGANSEDELSHLRGKALDARNSSFQAMESGVVQGGGVSLLNCIKDLPDTIGGKILRKSLLYPSHEIGKNLGFVGPTSDMIKKIGKDIIDSSNVVINSMTTAISVAATQLTTRAIEI